MCEYEWEMGDSELDHFPTTDWSLVKNAKRGGSDDERASLTSLLARYEPVIRRYLKHQKRVPLDRIDDTIQGFIADRFLERRLPEVADRSRGKFRNLLVRALEHYLIDRIRQERSTLRSAIGTRLKLEDIEVSITRHSDPSKAFDRAWAETVIQDAVELTKTWCEQKGRQAHWNVFAYRMLGEGEDAPPTYREIVDRFGFTDPVAASNALITCKRTFTRSLRQVLSKYVPVEDAAAFEREVQELKLILAG